MNNHPARIGNFTSSEIVALLSNGKRELTAEELLDRPKKGKGSKITTVEDESIIGDAAMTYIKERNWERRLGRSLSTEIYSRATVWGSLCEKYVMSKPELIGIEYEQRPDEPIVNPLLDYHSGSPDMTKKEMDIITVSDLKSPYTLLSFCQLVDPLYNGLKGMDAMNVIRDIHKDGEKFYWQLVSNAILTKSKFAELIIFCPYLDELNEIRDIAQQSEGSELSKYYGIAMSEDGDLPYLIEGEYYKNINFLNFEVPESDKKRLLRRIELAGKMLIQHFPQQSKNQNT